MTEKLADLRGRLRKSETAFLTKYTDRVAVLERWRPGFAGGAVVGALIAALSRLAAGELSVGLAVGGAVLTAVCGALVALMDFKKLEIGQDAKDANALADEALAELEKRENEIVSLESKIERASHFDEKRLHRIEATRLMVETVEAALLANSDVDKTAANLLNIAAARIRSAADYKGGDFFTLTLFKKAMRKSQQVMVPIAREWTDPGAAIGGRSWGKGQGYTGVLWTLASSNPSASVVEPDTTLPGIKEKYPVAPRDEAREKRYRSVASFPIMIRNSNEVWGVVTATSDRACVFDHIGDLARQSVETIRDIAMAAGLLAGLNAHKAP